MTTGHPGDAPRRPVAPGLARWTAVLGGGAALLALGLLVLGCTRAAPTPAPPPARAPIRLVVLLAIDQLRPDRVSADMPGGLGRLWREGRRFEDAALEHAHTDTCPGHVSMSTGRHPGPAGVPGNMMIERATLEASYCLVDDVATAAVLGRGAAGPGDEGRSPGRIGVTTLGDWMKARDPASRVFGVAGKDRSAIALGGHQAQAAYFIDRGGSGGFTTSRYYEDVLPDWVAAWGPERMLERVPEQWVLDPAILAVIEDDRVGEAPHYGRTSPHPVSDPGARGGARIAPLLATPYADQLTLAFARELIERESLGADAAPDLLGLGLSATDTVGHLYGPGSAEAADALAHLDADLADFFAFLDARVGWQHVLLVVTADHGVLPIPEQIPAAQRTCPVASGRISGAELNAELSAHLDARFPTAARGGHEDEAAAWFARERHMIVLNPARAVAAGVSLEDVSRDAAAFLTARPGMRRAWTRADLDAAQADAEATEMARLFRNSQTPGYEADLLLEFEPNCLLSDQPYGTSHGSPWPYDRRVPLVFIGAGVEAGVVSGRAATVDIAPTLAAALGLEPGVPLDGRVLPLASP